MNIETVSAFDKNVEDYDLWYREEPGSLIFESEVRAVESFSLRGSGIEIGVGTGIFSSRLKIAIGLDPSVEMLERAKGRSVSVIRGFAESLPVKDGCLDYVVFLLTICFLKDLALSFREAWRILSEGGQIIVGFIPRNSRWGELYSKKGSEGHETYKYARFYTLGEVESLLTAAGFKLEGYSATLSQEPEVFREIENPSSDLDGHGFVCVKAIKV